KELEHKKIDSERNIERFSRLHNDYQNDINKIKSAKAAKELIGKESKNNTSCPICESVLCTEDISEHFEISDNVKLDNEINSITRRCRELLELIHKNRSDLTEHVKNL
ncbi:hypothetical protein EAY10_22085, partial [Vibrio anguillarum]|nr:hypothetical protein [Vibrio anguillarum]